MRLFDYLYEDAIRDGLEVSEPEINRDYSDEFVKNNIKTIKTALSQTKKKKFSDEETKSSVVADLEDKLNKWKNVDKETKAPPPPPPEDAGGEGESEGEEIADEREEEAEQRKEEADDEREEEKKKKEEEKKKKNEGRLIKSIIRRRKK
jgi:two-component system chemotaxis sensor kinase CheA